MKSYTIIKIWEPGYCQAIAYIPLAICIAKDAGFDGKCKAKERCLANAKQSVNAEQKPSKCKASESYSKMNFYKIKLYEKILNKQLKWKIIY